MPRLGAVSRTRGPSPTLLRLAPDTQLVSLVRAGREDAFEAVYNRHKRGILAFCGRLLGDRDDAEDAVQLTFMSAYNALLGDDRAVQLRPWLFAIARNRCYTMLRERRELATPDPTGTETVSEGPATLVQRREDIRDLVHDLSGLPDDQRAALVMAELGALSHDEIALALEIPRSKVKALVFQARESLTAARRARETDCADIRRELSTLRGPALRRSHLRRHLHSCSGCQEYRHQLRSVRGWAAAVIPAPLAGLRQLLARAGTAQEALPAAAGGSGGAVAVAVKLGAVKPIVGSVVTVLGAVGALAAAGHAVGTHASGLRVTAHPVIHVLRPGHRATTTTPAHHALVLTRHPGAAARRSAPVPRAVTGGRPLVLPHVRRVAVHRVAVRDVEPPASSAPVHTAPVTPASTPAVTRSHPAVGPAPVPESGARASAASASAPASRRTGDDPTAESSTPSRPVSPRPVDRPVARHDRASPRERRPRVSTPVGTPSSDTHPVLASHPIPRPVPPTHPTRHPVTPSAPGHTSTTGGPRIRLRLPTTITRRSA